MPVAIEIVLVLSGNRGINVSTEILQKQIFVQR